MNYLATLRPESDGTRLSEPAPAPPLDLTGGELEVQARWFAGAYGASWTTTDGRPAQLLDFGTWNHEAGPDFTAATVRIGNDPPRRGAIEIDTDVRDWERHGHAANPAFDDTILHVFLNQPASTRVFTRTSTHRSVPQIQLHSATPIRAPAPTSRLITDEPTRACALLHAAARHRLHHKAALLAEAARLRGRDNAWFEALAIALGYKRNRLPFQLVAQRIGLAAARAPEGESRLFGLAGFLEATTPEPSDPAIRATLRALWDSWWDDRARLERLILPADQWSFVGIRPANHPHRRLAALHAIASNWKPIRSALETANLEKFHSALGALTHPFWSTHYNLAAAPLPKPIALIGAQRVADIVLNVFYPIAHLSDERAWHDYIQLPGPPVAKTIQTTAETFFAQSDPAFLRSAIHQQGLLQLQRDFDEAVDPRAQLTRWRETAATENAKGG